MPTSMFVFVAPIFVALAISCGSPNSRSETARADSTVEGREEKLTFPSLDGLPVHGLLYHHHERSPVIVLCHQARFNKFEYNKIATTLRSWGFNVFAIDQRSGGPIIETFNETMLEAKARGKATEFLDAEQDIAAAVKFMSQRFPTKLILWGSSYSASLALHVASENHDIDAVVAFSPNDYFGGAKPPLSESITKLVARSTPLFLTSSKAEAPDLAALLATTTLTTNQVLFVPTTAGEHGSRALWKPTEGNEEYWAALEPFFARLK